MAASSPHSSSNVARDAIFLFELFRESPTPIIIQIGPYANKTGSKPNTIIKRLAGIKRRHGLNINTTLGDYRRPSIDAKAEPNLKKEEEEEAQTGVANANIKYEVNEKEFGVRVGLANAPQSFTIAPMPPLPLTPLAHISPPYQAQTFHHPVSHPTHQSGPGAVFPPHQVSTSPAGFISSPAPSSRGPATPPDVLPRKRKLQYTIEDDGSITNSTEELEMEYATSSSWKKIKM